MHGNVAEWVLDPYVEDLYAQSRGGREAGRQPGVRPRRVRILLRRPGRLVGLRRLRLPERHPPPLGPDLELQDPQRPQSIWWHTDATFVGFRIVRPLEEVPELAELRSNIRKGSGPRPEQPSLNRRDLSSSGRRRRPDGSAITDPGCLTPPVPAGRTDHDRTEE